jgi:cyclophilin family peptidyl-prolyl cis-trans isomerase
MLFATLPAPAADLSRPAAAILNTELGDLTLLLDWTRAPESCRAFVRYVREGVYAGTAFDENDEHSFYGGKPARKFPRWASNGNMNPDEAPPGEYLIPNVKGTVGFRRTTGDCNPDQRSNCTQIFIHTQDRRESDGKFTAFGTIEGEPAVIEAIRGRIAEKKPVPFKVELPGE